MRCSCSQTNSCLLPEFFAVGTYIAERPAQIRPSGIPLPAPESANAVGVGFVPPALAWPGPVASTTCQSCATERPVFRAVV